MKINGGPDKVLGLYNKQGIKPSRVDRAEGPRVVKGQDKFELSIKAKDFQVALKALGNAPDIRDTKVAKLKSLIDSGKYNVDADEVADSIIDSLILDKRV